MLHKCILLTDVRGGESAIKGIPHKRFGVSPGCCVGGEHAPISRWRKNDFMSWGSRLYPIHEVLGLEGNGIVQHRVDAQRRCSGVVSMLQEDQLY